MLAALRHRLREPGDRVIAIAAVMIAAQLGFRAWAVYGGYFQLDDIIFVSLLGSQPLDRELVATSYDGHLMPLAMLLSWLNMQADPLNWIFPATELLIMQAIASVGMLVFLASAFGRRFGILVLLAIYLFTVISFPAFIWWAAGVNALPLQIAIGWGGWAHLNYLRSRRIRWLTATILITIFSLGFFEKSLLLYVYFGFLALAYFATGGIRNRVAHILRIYWRGVVAHGIVVLGYLAYYLTYGLNFDPKQANDEPLMQVMLNVVGVSFGSGVVGGPVQWSRRGELFSFPSPPQLLNLLALAIIGAIIYEISRSRSRSNRAWALPATFLFVIVVLVAGGRTFIMGPDLALDYRYQSELSALAPIALGLALFPLRGAIEEVVATRTSSFLDRPLRVGIATLVVALLGTYSSASYAQHWHSADTTRNFYTNVNADLTSRDNPAVLINAPVPEHIISGFRFPYNLAENALRMFTAKTTYASSATDELNVIDQDGRVRPVVIDALRRNVPSQTGCPHPARFGRVPVLLDEPVFGSGWWVRVSYASDGDSPLVVRAGDERHEPGAQKGLHNLFFEASGEFQTIEFSGLDPDVTFCITEVELGVPTPANAADE